MQRGLSKRTLRRSSHQTPFQLPLQYTSRR